MPDFFAEGNTPRRKDTIWRILQKILDAGGTGGSSSSNNPAYEIYPAGTATPNNPARPALRYTDDAGGPLEEWVVASQTWV